MADGRYYIHGDERTRDGTVYCRRCDSFVFATHFYEYDIHGDLRRQARIVSDYERASRDLWMISRKEVRDRFNRPKDAPNIFL